MSDSFSAFMATIGQIPVLTKTEEIELAKRIEKGDQAAKDKLVRHNIRLAVSVARRYSYNDLPLEDLVQEAMLGVDRAADKFDYRKGFKFSTYATWWIRHFIQRAVYKDRATIRVPGHIIARRKAIERYLREHPESELSDAAAHLGITVETAEESLDGARVVASLDAPYAGESVGDRHDMYADETAPDPAEVAEDVHPGLAGALAALPDIERRVIELRYGLGGDHPLSRDKTAEVLQVRPHVVQRSQRAAIKKLRSELSPDLMAEVEDIT